MLEAYLSVLNRIQNYKKWINFNIEKLKANSKLFFRRSVGEYEIYPSHIRILRPGFQDLKISLKPLFTLSCNHCGNLQLSNSATFRLLQCYLDNISG